MKGLHDYDTTCMCFRCKGIRNSPEHKRTVRVKTTRVKRTVTATRAEQYGRYLDCGPSNWDDR